MKNKMFLGLLLMFVFIGHFSTRANSNSVVEATQIINKALIDSSAESPVLERTAPTYLNLNSVSNPTDTYFNPIWMIPSLNIVVYKLGVGDNCSQYYGRGYCTDFIEKMTGKRQRGNAGQWAGNITNNQGKAGDVAIFSSPSPYGHVGYITRPVYQHNTANLIAYDIQEWNWGNQWANRSCAVTNKFGITTSRRVAVSSVSRIWRP